MFAVVGSPMQIKVHVPNICVCVALVTCCDPPGGGATAPEAHVKTQAYLLQRALLSERDRWQQVAQSAGTAATAGAAHSPSLFMELSSVCLSYDGAHDAITAAVALTTSSCTVSMAFPHPQVPAARLQRQFLYAGQPCATQ